MVVARIFFAAIFEVAGILGMKESAVRFEHEEMGISCHLGIAGEKYLILILIAEIDFDHHEIGVEKIRYILIGFEESVEEVAPFAPFAADIEQNSIV